jgi:hypothetical protein
MKRDGGMARTRIFTSEMTKLLMHLLLIYYLPEGVLRLA